MTKRVTSKHKPQSPMIGDLEAAVSLVDISENNLITKSVRDYLDV